MRGTITENEAERSEKQKMAEAIETTSMVVSREGVKLQLSQGDCSPAQ